MLSREDGKDLVPQRIRFIARYASQHGVDNPPLLVLHDFRDIGGVVKELCPPGGRMYHHICVLSHHPRLGENYSVKNAR